MSLKRVFNPFTQTFDAIQDLKTLTWQDPVETYNDLPTTGNNENDARFAKDTDILYVWTSSDSSGDISNWKEVSSMGGVAPHADTHLPDGSDPVYTVIYEKNGKIGIGVANPNEKFEVDGNIKINGNVIANYVNRIASKLINENNIGDGKVLIYDASTDNIQYTQMIKDVGNGELEVFVP